MKGFKYNRWLVLVIVIGLLAALAIGFQRHAVERANRQVDLAIDYEGLQELAQRRNDCIKAMLVMAAFSMEGAVTVCRMLPGYDLNFGIMHGIFLLLLYPAAAIVLDKLMLKEQVEHGN